MKRLAAFLFVACHTPPVAPPTMAPAPPAKPSKLSAEVRSFNRKVPPVHSEWLVLTLPSEKAAATITATLEKQAVDGAKSFILMTEKAKAERENPAFVNPDEWDMNRRCRATLLRAALVSVRCDEYQYAGGAHGMTVALSETWRIVGDDVQPLALADLFVDPWIPTVDPLVMDVLREQEADWVIDGSLKTVADMLHTWNVSADGLTFTFNPYEAGSYAQGMHEVTLKWADLARVVRRPGPLDPVIP